MKPRIRKTAATLCITALFGLAVGCQPAATTSEEDDHHHHHGHGRPTSLTAAVAQLVEIRNEIQSAMRGGKPGDAHHSLHEVGELLDVLPEVAADTDLSREKWEEAKATTNKLFDAFNTIDEAFHTAGGDKQGAYEKVAVEIDTLLASLEALVPLAGENPGSGVEEHAHDHDDHDHDHDHDHAETSKQQSEG